jgi:hypothetical protein
MNEGKVNVPKEVLEGLLEVRNSGVTNMFDMNNVARAATIMGHQETSKWIKAHEEEYVSGVFNGFVAEGE